MRALEERLVGPAVAVIVGPEARQRPKARIVELLDEKA
jgi:hypothetical protein